MEGCKEDAKELKNKEMGYISVMKGKRRYKLFLSDINKVFKLQRRKMISLPVFQEKTPSNDSTDADIEDNG